LTFDLEWERGFYNIKRMAAFRKVEEIEAWQAARELNRRVWDLIEAGSLGKDFALSDQINRAAGSTMDNIAEGFESGSG